VLRSTVISLSALLIGASILFVGHGIQSTLVPIWAHNAGFEATTVGSLWSAYSAGLMLGCLTAGRVIEAVGHIRAFAALMSLIAVIVLTYTFYPFPAFWLLLRALHGFFIAGVFMIIESWLNEKTDDALRGVVLGIYTALTLVMIAVGQLSINLLDVFDPKLFSLAAILLMLAVVPVALTRAGIPGPVVSPSIDLVKLWRSGRVALIGSFCVGLTTSAFWGLGPVFARGVGFDTEGLTLFMSVTIFGGAVFQWLVGRVSDRMDRRHVIAVGSLIAAVAGLGIFFLAGQSLVLVLALSLVFGGFAFALQSLCVALGNDRAAPGDFVEIAGGLMFIYGLGSILGPLFAATLVEFYLPEAIFVFTATIHLILAVTAVVMAAGRPAVPEGQKREYQAVPATSPEVFAIDPRGEQGEGAKRSDGLP